MTVLLIFLIALICLQFALLSSAKEDIDYILSNHRKEYETLVELKHAFDNLHEGFLLLRRYNEIQDERLAELEKLLPKPEEPTTSPLDTTITCDSTSEVVISDDAPKPKKRTRKKKVSE